MNKFPSTFFSLSPKKRWGKKYRVKIRDGLLLLVQDTARFVDDRATHSVMDDGHNLTDVENFVGMKREVLETQERR